MFGKVVITDQTIYGDLGPFGAHYSTTLTNKTGDIPKAKWDEMRVGMLCMDSKDFASSETSKDQLCKSFNVCDYQTQDKVLKTARVTKDVATAAQKGKKRYKALKAERGFKEDDVVPPAELLKMTKDPK